MSSRYEDRDDERGRRNYGRRSGREDDRSYGQSGQGGYGRSFEDEAERYATESRWRGQGGGQSAGGQYYGTGRNMYRGGGESQSSQDWGNEGWEDRDYSSERNRRYGSSGRESGGGYGGMSSGGYGSTRYGDEYGGSYGGGYGGGQARYRDTSGSYSQGSSYPGDYSSGARYGERGREYGDYGRSRYGEGRGGYREGEDRGWWDRISDTLASWFGDEEAERRRRMERPYQGRGPKGYRRSDERIKEDVNDRLSEGYLDATEIEVTVTSGEVILIGTVDSRADKRRAEAIAENVSGVNQVENRLRVRDRQQLGAYGTGEGAGMSGTSSTGTTGAGTTGATGAGAGSTGSTSGTARGKSASS